MLMALNGDSSKVELGIPSNSASSLNHIKVIMDLGRGKDLCMCSMLCFPRQDEEPLDTAFLPLHYRCAGLALGNMI